jgi:hypothetical protein
MGMGITLFHRTSASDDATDAHLDLCADDLRRLLEIERGQRLLLRNAYEGTVVALARALESKDSGTGAHSQPCSGAPSRSCSRSSLDGS